MCGKLKENKNLVFIVLIILIAIILGFILGTEFKEAKNVNVNQNVNINTAKTDTKDKINLNSATQKELELLEGIGEVKAKKIIEKRPYKNTSELINIVGEKTYQNIKDKVEVR